MFDEGFADLTMAELASRLNCSLRTLYALAPSRDELVLIVVDRTSGASAAARRARSTPTCRRSTRCAPISRAAHVAVMNTTEPFARDLAAVPSAQRLREAHQGYLCAVTKRLLDAAVDRGDIAAIDTSAVARALSRLGADFAEPDVLGELADVAEGRGRPRRRARAARARRGRTEERHDDGGPRSPGRRPEGRAGGCSTGSSPGSTSRTGSFPRRARAGRCAIRSGTSPTSTARRRSRSRTRARSTRRSTACSTAAEVWTRRRSAVISTPPVCSSGGGRTGGC